MAEGPTESEDRRIVLSRIPEGHRVKVDGKQMMAYDIEQFKELVEIELDLRDALSQIKLLGTELRLSEERLGDAGILHQRCMDALKAWEGVVVEPPVEDGPDLVTWALVGTNVLTGTLLGVLLYVFVTH